MTEPFFFNRIDAAELTRFTQHIGEHGKNAPVAIGNKLALEDEVHRRVLKMQFDREDRSYAKAWEQFLELSRINGTEESALLRASLNATRTVLNYPVK